MTEPRPLLGGRYSLERPVASSVAEDRWMAIEAATGRLVVVAIADAGRLSTLHPARDVRHRHLATVVDVVREVPPDVFPSHVKVPVGAGVAVAEHVPGRTLRAVLEGGPLHPAKAVAWLLRLADAVQVLHSNGAVHGAISPRSIIAEPEGRAIAPVLSQLIVPPLGAYCPPERLRGAAESASDDVWALTAVLYVALTGKAPYSAVSREALLKAMLSRPRPLSASGIQEPVLDEIILRGLLPDRRGRAVDLADLQSYLDGWEREPTRVLPPRSPPRPVVRGLSDLASGAVATAPREDDILVDDTELKDDAGRTVPPPPVAPAALEPASEPPIAPAARPFGYSPSFAAAPAPAGPAPAKPGVPRRVSFNPFERKQPMWPLLAVGAAVLAVVLYFVLGSDSTPAAPTPVASAEEAKVPVPAAPRPVEKRSPEIVRNECVRDHFPPASFEGQPDFSFVCEDGDFPAMARRLGDLVLTPVVAGAGDGGIPISDAASPPAPSAIPLRDGGVASELGWYEVPVTAIIRKACCPNSSPVVLPETKGWCDQLEAVVRRMADDSAKATDLSPSARTYLKAVNCVVADRGFHPYAYVGPPSPASRNAFQQFLGRAAIVSTKR